MYQELISQLKKVKSAEFFSQDLALELIAAGISMQMITYQRDEKVDPKNAMDMTRMDVLNEFDEILLTLTEEEEGIHDDFLGESDDLSPMSDATFRADIEKAIQSYNDRIEKK